MKHEKNYKINIALFAALFSIFFFAVFGTVTVLIPNTFFVRMTPTSTIDYVFLALTSVFLGTYLSFHTYQKKASAGKCTAAAYGGGVFGFLSFGCSVCNKILVLALGMTGVLVYIEPYRPYLGTAGIALMAYAVYAKGKETFWQDA
ncbi:MAG: hypothetical protein V3S46_00740 [Nitrospinota bacterium]